MSVSEKLFVSGIFPMSRDKDAPRTHDERDDESMIVADEIYELVSSASPHPEVALLSLVRVMADLFLMIEDDSQRSKMIRSVVSAIEEAASETDEDPDGEDEDEENNDDEDGDEGGEEEVEEGEEVEEEPVQEAEEMSKEALKNKEAFRKTLMDNDDVEEESSSS